MSDNLVTLEAFRQQRDEPPALPADTSDMGGIRPLGFDHGTYYYLSPITGQIVQIPADRHTLGLLEELKPALWWYEAFTTEEKGRFDLVKARGALKAMCHNVGVFRPDRLRGPGVWWDDGGTTVHLGDRVLMGGDVLAPHDVSSSYIYERGAALPWRFADPLDDNEALAVLDACDLIGWDRPGSGQLLAGWIVCSLVCGAMWWRPHIWLTAEAGAGKSWVIEHVIKPLLGPLRLSVQSQETTEAGIRQMLGSQARPIVYDEADRDNEAAQERLGKIISFARAASVDTDAVIAKGTAGHVHQVFNGRTAFCMASIAVPLIRQADQTRFTVLSMRGVSGDDFTALERAADAFDRGYAERLLARVLRHVGVLRHNHLVLAKAVAERLGTRRLGDQIGGLLAGAHLLRSSERLSTADAAAILADVDLSTELQVVPETEQEMCWRHLCASSVTIDMSGGRQRMTVSLGELMLCIVSPEMVGDEIDHAVAMGALARRGVRVRDGTIIIANQHPELDRMFRGTPYRPGWSRMLLRLPGAEVTPNSQRFVAVKSRAVAIPTHNLPAAGTLGTHRNA
jgi:putative DNA primase/helicase